jgi:hypothetical protein
MTDRKGRNVAGNEPVTSPDQHKPGHRKGSRIAVILVIIGLLLMAVCGNHRGRVEDIFLVATAALLALVLVGDAALRRNGLRSPD